MTLVELLVSLAVGVLVVLATGELYLQTSEGFIAQFNYVDLDNQCQTALDLMSQQIRQTGGVTNASPTELVLNDSDGTLLTFRYDARAKTLTRSNALGSRVLLSRCDSLQFSLFQRNPVGGDGDFVSTTNASDCKLIKVSWTCSRPASFGKVNTESIDGAKIMIRNKK